MPDLLPTALFGLTLLAFVGLGEALRAWAGWRPEATRRTVHALTGVAVALCPPFFSSPAGIYALAALFVGINVVAVRRRLFRGMHGTARETWGTVAFPLALIAALFLCWTLPHPLTPPFVEGSRVYILRVAFLVLAVADPVAAWVGGRASGGRYRVNGQTKTAAGSLAFVASAGAVAALGFALWAPWGGLALVASGAVLVAALAGAAEAIGSRGWDNLWIVLAVVVGGTAFHLAATGLVLHSTPEAEVLPLLGALALAGAFAAFSVRVGFLDVSGGLAAGLLAWAVVGIGGVAWAVPGFVFFFASSVLSRLGKRRKREAEAKAAKGSRRDAQQVAANGGVAGAVLAAALFAPWDWGPLLYWSYVGAFAAAAADTWGTEIGTWVGGRTWDVARLRAVAPGESGGVSLAGSLGGVAGAAVVVVVALPFFADAFLGHPPLGAPSVAAAVAAGAGVLAAWVDSALGATVQARFRLPDGSLSERPGAGPLARGWAWVTNDRVNLACTLVGAAVPLAVLAW